MANEQDKNPTTGTEADISKAQSQQQPPQQASQPSETAQEGAELSGDQAATGQTQTGQAPDAGPDEGLQGETTTQQRTDIEGASLQSEKGEAESAFVGSKAEEDTSEELVERRDEDREGFTPEGK